MTYCWEVDRPATDAERTRLRPDEWRMVAMGRQPTIDRAKAAARKNHEVGCATSVWRLGIQELHKEPVWEYAPRPKDGAMCWRRRGP